MKKLILFIILFITLISVSAENLKEEKKILVIDKQTKEELIGAKVIVNDSTYYTDLYGYVIVNLTKDSTIEIIHPSYQTKKVIGSENQIVELITK